MRRLRLTPWDTKYTGVLVAIVVFVDVEKALFRRESTDKGFGNRVRARLLLFGIWNGNCRAAAKRRTTSAEMIVIVVVLRYRSIYWFTVSTDWTPCLTFGVSLRTVTFRMIND